MKPQVYQNGVGPVAHLSFSGDFGGREKVAVSLCRSMSAYGHPCHLYMVVEERAGRERNDNLLESLGDVGSTGRFFRTGSRFSPRLLAELVAHLRQDRIGVLHCHCYKSLYYAVLMRAFGRYDGLIVYTLHGLVLGGGIMASLIQRSQQVCLRLVDGVIGCSREILESSMPEHGQVITDSIINAIELPEIAIASLDAQRAQAREYLLVRYGLNPEGAVVVNVGRLCRQKNFSLFLDLIHRNVIEFGDGRNNYLIVGNGELQGELESRANDLGIRNRVIFTGFVQDMATVYAGADLLVQTSIWEGTPMCLLEARSHALPCVAPAVGGNLDVVNHGEDGFLYEVNNFNALAAHVDRYLDDGALRRSHGLAAYGDTADRFTPLCWVERHVQFYNSIAAEKRERVQ